MGIFVVRMVLRGFVQMPCVYMFAAYVLNTIQSITLCPINIATGKAILY